MIFRYSFVVCAYFMIMFLGKLQVSESKPLEPEEERNESKEFPLDLGQVVSDASNVFGNVVGKMIAKKRILGMDNWFW